MRTAKGSDNRQGRLEPSKTMRIVKNNEDSACMEIGDMVEYEQESIR